MSWRVNKIIENNIITQNTTANLNFEK